MFLKFEEWLIIQQSREDLIGDLARVLSKQNTDNKSSRGRFDEHKSWVDIVIGIAEPEYIPVFNDAWQEFVLAKQAARDSLDEFRFLKNGRSGISSPPHPLASIDLPQLVELKTP